MAVGIIAEYNPFHNGHKYMLQKVRYLAHNEPILVCISGSITQRGEPAILDKWQRALAAVKNGADLVIELPAVFACRSAEAFGRGAVQLLSSTGIVGTLAFGTKYPDIERLLDMAAMQPDDYMQELKDLLKAGHSYGAALGRLIAQKLSLPEDMLKEPNTILALEYLRAINRLKLEQGITITPLPILRQGAGHNAAALEEGCHSFASGMAIRQAAISAYASFDDIQQFVPQATFESLASAISFPDTERLFPLLCWQLLASSPDKLRTILGMAEGLEHRLIQSLGCNSYKNLIKYLSTRRYPAARIRRLLIHLLLGLEKRYAQAADTAGPLYIRVLAFNNLGRKLLKDIKEHCRLPVITKTADYLSRLQMENKEGFSPLQQMLYIDILSGNLRAMTMAKGSLYQDLLQSPIYVR